MPRPYFHKLIVSSIIRAKQLRIPENFVKKFKDDLSTVATLNVADGHVWRIALKKADNNKIWFNDGWQDFVERYGIRSGYLLVFRYEGNSAFNVYVFNVTASEINYQSNALNSSQAMYGGRYQMFEEMLDDDYEEIPSLPSTRVASGPLKSKLFGERAEQLASGKVFNPPSLQNLFNGSKLNCINWGGEGGLHPPKCAGNNFQAENQQLAHNMDAQFNNIMEHKRSADETRMSSEERKVKKPGRKKRKIDGQESSIREDEEDVDPRFRFYESASARKRTVTAEERERAINTAKTFEPSNPFCRVVLRPSYLYRGCIMYLPSCFAEKNLSGVSGFIKLQSSDGRQWPVRCLFRGGRAKLSQGWYEFTLENNLGEGDVCVFEMLRTKEIVLKVTFFRVIDEAGMMSQPPPQHIVNHGKLVRSGYSN